MLHSGATPIFRDRCVRETGIGPEQGISYRLECGARPARSLAVTFAGERHRPLAGVVRIGTEEHIVADTPPHDFTRKVYSAPPKDGAITVALWSTSPYPLAIAQLEWTV
jgi:hypothetical protein